MDAFSMLEILLPDDRTSFEAGEVIDVTASWSLETPADVVELRLLWNTVGKGDRNLSVEKFWKYEQPLNRDRVTETIQLPTAPYSFSGKLVSLVWAFELIALPGGDSTRREIILSPDAQEILLTSRSGDDE